MTNDCTPTGDTSLRPNIDQARKHLEILDEDADTFTFQTFDESGQKRPELTRLQHGTLDQHWDGLVELNSAGAGIFVAVNETDLTGRTRQNMRRIRCVFQEDDVGATVDFPLEPHLVVNTSPGKNHRYWICDGPSVDDDDVDTEVLAAEFRPVQERLIADYGSDPNAKDVTRVLRLAGFYHRKNEPHLVRIVEENSRLPYNWAEITDAFPPCAAHRTGHTAIVKDMEGRVIDGRDQLLSQLAYSHVCNAIAANTKADKPPHDCDVEKLAGLVWAQFRNDAELDRPKSMDIARYQSLRVAGEEATGIRWQREDALEKVKQKLRAAVAGTLPMDMGVSAVNAADAEELAQEAFAEELVSQAADDAGAPFKPENLQRLVQIRAEYRHVYERIYAKLRDVKGFRISELDREVKRLASVDRDTLQGTAIDLPEPDPWPDPVDGFVLVQELVALIERHVILPQGSSLVVALWAILAHKFDDFSVCPRLSISSATLGSGKTTLLKCLKSLVPRPLMMSNISPAAIFRTVEAAQPTLLIDEGDSFLKLSEEMRGLLNSGHDRSGAYTIRVVGDGYEPRKFSTWCPMAFALIGKLPDTVESRSIVIAIERKRPEDQITPLRVDRMGGFDDLARKIARWAADHELSGFDPIVADALQNRNADNWRPIFAIADEIGGGVPTEIRQIALSMDGDRELTNVEQMLADIKNIFDEASADKLSSEIICEKLGKMEERAWSEWRNGKPITQRALAAQLKPFRVSPSTIRLGTGATPKGYTRAQFENSWSRHITPETSATTP